MSSMDRWIHRALRRLHFGRFLQAAADWLAGFLFVFGSAVLAVKLLAPSAWPHVLWTAAACVPVTVAAWFLSRQDRHTRTESVALLDQRLQTGGLLLTLSEQPDAAWQERLPQVEQAWRDSLPRIRPIRFARLVAVPAAFALAACFVPLRQIEAEPILRNAAGKTASRQLEETLAALEEAKILEPEEQRQLKEEIEKLADEAREQPLTHEKWETVDALRERLKLRLDTAQLGVSKARDTVSSLKQALKEAGLTLTPEQEAGLEEEALETLRKLQKKREGLQSKDGKGSAGKPGLQRLMKNGRFSDDPAQRQQELEELDEFLQEEDERLSQCRGKCPGGQGDGGEDGGDGEDGQPGRGGVNRGRGDADLNYDGESEEQGVKFKESVLPPGFLDQPSDEVIQVTPSAPDEKPAANAPRSTARGVGSATGDEAVNRQLRPRHKQVVRQYFDSK